MTYVISDLHGRYDLYRAMLEKIKLSDKDALYILGDIVDRGDEGLKIVLDVGNRDNVTVIMGNHDYLALTVLLSINRGFRPGELADMRHIIDSWNFDGGAATYNEYRNLSQADQKLALMIMDSFRNFAEIKIGGNEFVLCHGGIGNFSPERELSDYSIEDLAFYREDYSKAKFATPGKYLITGHTPTAAIEGAEEGRIYKNKDHIAIDCGAVFGYGLGCICLDTMEEFYVNE